MHLYFITIIVIDNFIILFIIIYQNCLNTVDVCSSAIISKSNQMYKKDFLYFHLLYFDFIKFFILFFGMIFFVCKFFFFLKHKYIVKLTDE